MKTIEKVAEAIHNIEGIMVPYKALDENSELKRVLRLKAKAAILAMREPTDEMKNCSDEVHWGYGCNVCGGLTEGWHAMIDEALKDE